MYTAYFCKYTHGFVWPCFVLFWLYSSAFQIHVMYLSISLITLYILKFSEGKKHIFTFYVIPPQWYDTGSWNPFLPQVRQGPTYSTYHGFWCPGDERSHGISNHDIDLVKARWLISHTLRVNSLWPSGTIWRHRSGSTLAQVMACCLTAPSHYLNQCWLIISTIQWHSSEGNFTRDILAINNIR